MGQACTQRARRASFFGAVAAASEFHRQRAARGSPPVDPWSGVRRDRRDRYLSGEGRLSKSLVAGYCSEYPEATDVWRSVVWQYVDLDTSGRQCENRLYEELAVRRSACRVEELLIRCRAASVNGMDTRLDGALRGVLGLRVAQERGLMAEASLLASSLATNLLFLTGCPFRRASSEQLWKLCGGELGRGLKWKGRHPTFSTQTWEFVAKHALRSTIAFRSMAYASPLAAEMPSVVAEELIRDIVCAITTEDADRATFVFSQLNHMDPMRTPGDALPDVEALSIWRST